MQKIKRFWRFLVEKWLWVYGISLGAGVLGTITIMQIAPSSADTTIYYLHAAPLSFTWLLLICGIPGTLFATILYFIRSRKGAKFALLMVLTLIGTLILLAIIGPAVGVQLEHDHMVSARMDGHVYRLARTTFVSYTSSTWILYQCDTFGVRCSEVHRDTHSSLYYDDGVALVPEADTLSVVIAGRTVYSYEPED